MPDSIDQRAGASKIERASDDLACGGLTTPPKSKTAVDPHKPADDPPPSPLVPRPPSPIDVPAPDPEDVPAPDPRDLPPPKPKDVPPPDVQ